MEAFPPSLAIYFAIVSLSPVSVEISSKLCMLSSKVICVSSIYPPSSSLLSVFLSPCSHPSNIACWLEVTLHGEL